MCLPGSGDTFQELRAELEAMRRIHELGTRCVQGDDLRAILEDVVEAAIAIAGADFGSIQLIDARTGDLQIVAHRGFAQWWVDYWQSVSKGQGTCGTALAKGERIIVEDVERSPIFAGTPALDIQLRAGVRAVQSTPLVNRRGAWLGMFSTHYRDRYRPRESALLLLDQLARQVADIIDVAKTQSALAEREACYRAAVETSMDGFLVIDSEGRVKDANAAYLKASGFERNSLLTMRIADLEAQESPERIRLRLARVWELGHGAFVTHHRRHDGSTWPVELRIVYWPEAGGRAFVAVRDLTERLSVERRIIDAATVEQHRIGREIHDGIGQGLTAVSLMFGALRRELQHEDQARTRATLDEIVLQLGALQKQTRMLAQEFSPIEIGPEGLVNALEQLVELTRATSGLRCTLHVNGEPLHLDPIIALHLYRIAQEATSNALRHAHAKHIVMELHGRRGHLSLSVSDDGVGIDHLQPEGLGMSILGYRARSIGAKLTVGAGGNGGTRVECELRLPPKEANPFGHLAV